MVAAVFARPSHALAAFGDFLQVFLVGAAAAVFLSNALISRGPVRGFWFLMLLGFAIWTGGLLLWAYFEVWRGESTPDLPLGDTLLFLKLVPIAAALALEPHREDVNRPRAFGFLDLSLLLVFWLYLFAFWVLAYKLIPEGLGLYNFHFNVVDAIGNLILVAAVGLAALRTEGVWRRLYRIYFAAAVLYCVASNLSNVAIDLGKYYTGCLFDVPLLASMACFGGLGFAGRQILLTQPPKPSARPAETYLGTRKSVFWSSRLAMFVTLSTPVTGLWVLFSHDMPGEIYRFRILSTLITTLVLSVLLFVKQDLLSADLMRSLQEASESYTNLTRFRDQLIQSEKLASLGQLVAGVANEIKKAMVATLDHSGTLAARPSLDARIQSMVGKIDHYARRTYALVENMLSFAQETPLRSAPVDVKPLLESALNLSRVGKNAGIRIELQQEGNGSAVSGDASQLLQVFLHIIGNAVDAMEESGGGLLRITMRSMEQRVQIEFADSGPGMKDPDRVFEPFYTTKPVGKGTGLGLSTCYGIINRHKGEISCRNLPEGGSVFAVFLPCALVSAPPQEVAESLSVAEK
jgi:signal transduction histidine kinase